MKAQTSLIIALLLALAGCSPQSAEPMVATQSLTPEAEITLEYLTGMTDSELSEAVSLACPDALEIVGSSTQEANSQRAKALDKSFTPQESYSFMKGNEWVNALANRNTLVDMQVFVSSLVDAWTRANGIDTSVDLGIRYETGRVRAITEVSNSIREQCDLGEILDAQVSLESSAKVIVTNANYYKDNKEKLDRQAQEESAKAAAEAAQQEATARENAMFMPGAPRHSNLKVESFSCAGLGWGDTSARLKIKNTSTAEILAYARVVWLNSRGEVLGQAGAEAPTFPNTVSNLDVPIPKSINAYSDCKIAELTMFGEQ